MTRLFRTVSRIVPIVSAALILLTASRMALAVIHGKAGPYQVEVATRPAVISLGRAQLLIRLTDRSGKPVEGAVIRSLTKMPDMNMGEKEVISVPEPGQPGVYAAPAQFAMEGQYNAAFRIDGPQGSDTVTLALNTGQDTGTLTSVGGASAVRPEQNAGDAVFLSLLPWLLGGLLLAFVLYRMRQTGQKIAFRSLARRPVLGSLFLLALCLGVSYFVIHTQRRPGAMTPLEAQGMQMELPAPPGTAPVELAAAERGRIEDTVRYTGQAVGYEEQEITPRVTGTILWMAAYPGDRIRKGQALVRLDTSQSAPLVAGQRSGLSMAEQGVLVARKDYQQALAAVHEAHAEVGTRQGALEGAKADVKAAQEDRLSAVAQLESAQSMLPDADAQMQAARSDQRYWQQEISREQSLLKAGAVTQEEYQREKAQADNAEAKVQQAQARIAQTQAQVRAAQSAVRKADAMIASAQAKIEQTQAELTAHDAHVRSADAMAASARQKVSQAQAAVEQAKAALTGAAATQGYSEIRAQTDGMVTQRIVSPGVLVNPGQTILRVARIDPIRLQANVPEADLQQIHPGSRVQVYGREKDSRPASAVVTSVAPQVDPVARTGIVEVLLPNRDHHFLPGQYVTLEITLAERRDTVTVPTRALRYHTPPSGDVISTQAVPTVWIADSAGGQEGVYTVREVPVRIGLSSGAKTEILSGLKAGQKVLTAGQDYLKNGDSVMPVPPQSQEPGREGAAQ